MKVGYRRSGLLTEKGEGHVQVDWRDRLTAGVRELRKPLPDCIVRPKCDEQTHRYVSSISPRQRCICTEPLTDRFRVARPLSRGSATLSSLLLLVARIKTGRGPDC